MILPLSCFCTAVSLLEVFITAHPLSNCVTSWDNRLCQLQLWWFIIVHPTAKAYAYHGDSYFARQT
ncbi:hypothetical protein PVAP13_1KG430805 [Panicum virgatum]|uniref:Secreted protein n=1 Tax=Panicum virgatum TaxID=38727 RepID=A0A8T0XQG1_PANVG|nr:hypothetical protein PVAP13_1KG430805 [Panicum virgatum]